MDTLTPREIQTRIRSGESLASVVSASGLDPQRVEAFAGPVLAERAHITFVALAAPIRRAGESASSRALRQVVAERLANRGLDINQVDWDAWRRSDGRWIVEGRYRFGDAERVALFVFDHHGRFSLADNDEARWLIGDPSPSHGPRSSRRADPASEPTVDLPQPSSAELADPVAVTPSWVDVPASLLALPADDFGPGHSSSLDTLYDMISVIEEDSVRIYRGLREPLSGLDQDLPWTPDDEPVGLDPLPLELPETVRPGRTPPATTIVGADAGSKTAAEPEPTAPTEPPRRRGRKRERASVPSWDEIMFGGPPL